MPVPRFAVIGHPNKGKSSIVSTLAQDDTVAVSPMPGTTVACREFPMQVDGEVLYVLIDTPGFQRPRRALEWMQSHQKSAANRRDIVREFVHTFRHTDRFPDECELLTPVIEGAGILYVTDGSRPYGSEYEAEMEILRWTGQPSMALINPIGSEEYVEQWKAALAQFFRIVRTFNAVTEEFDKRLELLRAFGELQDEWREPLRIAIENLQADRKNRQMQSANCIADMLVDMLTTTVSKRLSSAGDPKKYEASLLQEYKDTLRRREQICRNAIEGIYEHHTVERREAVFELIDTDLFSKGTWLIFGLSKKQLITTGAISGAMLGTGVDLAVGGTSLLAGAALGTVIGGATALFTYDRLADVQVHGLPLGGSELRAGPSKNLNFPYVVLGRALFHHHCIRNRSHAQRGELVLEEAKMASSANAISESRRRQLERCFTQLRKNGESDSSGKFREQLTQMVDEIMTEAQL